MNTYPVVTIHGLLGWGEGETPIDYWGGVTNPYLRVHEATVGPISSFHDRACEVIAQVKGLRVDYGADHAQKHGHARYGKDYSDCGFHTTWSAKKPIHLVGHSAGGNSMRMVQHLLAIDHYNIGSTADWVYSISAISAPLNGTPMPHILGADVKTGMLSKRSIGSAITWITSVIANFAGTKKSLLNYSFELDHWGYTSEGKSLEQANTELKHLRMFEGTDHLVYDLTFNQSYALNGVFKSYPNTYYFGYATNQSFKPRFSKYYLPSVRMTPMLMLTSLLHGKYNFEANPAFPGWGTGKLINANWRANDGLVPEISQLYPFINDTITHKVSSTKGIRGKDAKQFEKGTWYYETVSESMGMSFDHMDIVCGSMADPVILLKQKQFFHELWKRLSSL